MDIFRLPLLVLIGFLITVPCFGADLIARPTLEDFLENPVIQGFTLSPDGQHIAVIARKDTDDSSYQNELRIYSIAKKQYVYAFFFPDKVSVMTAQWVNNSRVILWSGIKFANDEYSYLLPDIVAMNIDGSKFETIFGPRAGKEDLTSALAKKSNQGQSDFASMNVLNVLREDDEHILIGKTPWKSSANAERETYVVKLNVYTAKQTAIEKLPIPNATGVMDHNHVIRFAYTHLSDNKYELYYRKTADQPFEKIFSGYHSNGIWWPMAFLPDNQQVIISSNEDSGRSALYLYDTDTKERVLIVDHPTADVGSLVMSADELTPLFARFSTVTPELQMINYEHPESVFMGKMIKTFPGKSVFLKSTSQSGKIQIYTVTSEVDGTAYYLANIDTSKVEKLGVSDPQLQNKRLEKMHSIRFKARDDIEISGLITGDISGKEGPKPMVVLVHGGPYGGQDTWGYDDEVQLLASKGYLVLQVNFRGSDGFGRDFKYSAYKKWGEVMQDDVTDGTLWAIKSGLADADRICIMGHSYGGYAAIWGVIKEPTLYKCAIGSMGVYDLPYKFEETHIARSERLTQFYKDSLGTDLEALKHKSPINNVSKIKVPIMLAHGTKDDVSPLEQATRFRKALDEGHVRYEWLELKGTGHFYSKKEHRIQFYTKVIEFLDKYTAVTKN